MKLIRSHQSLARIKELYEGGSPDKALRSYYLPEFQLELIDFLADDTGLSKGGVLRNIIDEWLHQQLNGLGSE